MTDTTVAWVACRTGIDGFRNVNWHPGWMTVKGGLECCTCGVFVPSDATPGPSDGA